MAPVGTSHHWGLGYPNQALGVVLQETDTYQEPCMGRHPCKVEQMEGEGLCQPRIDILAHQLSSHLIQSIVEERERFASDTVLWEKYSDPSGAHLNQQAILVRLQNNREADNKWDAAAALKFFGNDLTRQETHQYFMYRKRNIVEVCQKLEAIARKWRELLAEHPEIAQAWARMQAEETA